MREDFLLVVLAVVLVFDWLLFSCALSHFFAGNAFGEAEACVALMPELSGVNEIDVNSNAQSEIAILFSRATEQSPD